MERTTHCKTSWYMMYCGSKRIEELRELKETQLRHFKIHECLFHELILMSDNKQKKINLLDNQTFLMTVAKIVPPKFLLIFFDSTTLHHLHRAKSAVV